MLKYLIALALTAPAAAQAEPIAQNVMVGTRAIEAEAPAARKIIALPVRTIERRGAIPVSASFPDTPAPAQAANPNSWVPQQTISAKYMGRASDFETGEVTAVKSARVATASRIRIPSEYADCVMRQIAARADDATIEIDMNACR